LVEQELLDFLVVVLEEEELQEIMKVGLVVLLGVEAVVEELQAVELIMVEQVVEAK
jgi:hypothetical protein